MPDGSRPRPIVVVTRALPEPVERALAERFDARLNATDAPRSADDLARAVRDADALLSTVTDRVDADVLRASPRRARIVAQFGAGTDNIDLAAARALGIVVTNTPDVLTEDTADVAILLVLAAARRLREGADELHAGRWTGWRPTHLLGASLAGKTLGIVGYGRIGRAVARKARAAFGMRVVWTGRHHARGDAQDDASDDATRLPSLDALLEASDVVSLHAPASPATRHLIDAGRLARMRPHAILVNTARGALVDEPALIDALRRGTIAAAGLDVFAHEPAVPAELLALPNVIALPHLGSATRETREAMGMLALENLVAFFDGREPPNRIA